MEDYNIASRIEELCNTLENALVELDEYKDDPDFCGWARVILGIGTEADALSHAPGTDGTMWEREELRRILLEEMIQKIEVWQDKKVCIYWNFCYNKQE